MNDRYTILIVDDDKDVLLGASKRLCSAGFQTLLARDGNEALASAAEHRPDAIILDVRMPRKDGLATLADLRADETTKNIPVVVLSASLGEQQAAQEAGARFFLRKPYSGPMLVDAAKRAIADGVPQVDATDLAKSDSTSTIPSSERPTQSATTTSVG